MFTREQSEWKNQETVSFIPCKEKKIPWKTAQKEEKERKPETHTVHHGWIPRHFSWAYGPDTENSSLPPIRYPYSLFTEVWASGEKGVLSIDKHHDRQLLNRESRGCREGDISDEASNFCGDFAQARKKRISDFGFGISGKRRTDGRWWSTFP